MIKEITDEIKFNLLKNRFNFQPVFLIGCGRSGTTILGRTLGKHKSITYLRERRDLWHKAYPEFDIWFTNVKNPKLTAEKIDNDPAKTDLLRRLFFKEQVINKTNLLLEKLPINNFRLNFLEEAFPNAKYIYLHRNGIEVAKSIQKLSDRGGWFAKHKTKWKLIEELMKESEIPIDNYTYFEKGLLEWRFSMDYSESFFSRIEDSRYYSLSYQSFIENPSYQVKNIYKFLDLKFNDSMILEFTKDIKRKSEKITKINDEHVRLAGNNLNLSIQNKLRHTFPNNI